jgi:hypothetical protein
MAYQDPMHNVTFQETVIGGGPSLGVSLGTITTNGTATYTGTLGTQVNGTFRLPVFKNPVNVLGIRVYTTTAPGNGVTGLVGYFLNGTTTFGTATLSTTVGYVDATLSALSVGSNGAQTGGVYFTSTSSNEPTMNLVGIGTASGSSLGSYSVDLVFRNLFLQ